MQDQPTDQSHIRLSLCPDRLIPIRFVISVPDTQKPHAGYERCEALSVGERQSESGWRSIVIHEPMYGRQNLLISMHSQNQKPALTCVGREHTESVAG
jgi:hypothetical protein